jgi:Spy/CpxP family protein refolding chaperone
VKRGEQTARKKSGETQVTGSGHRSAFRFVAAIALCVGLLTASHAADPRYPDWPCAQAKVPEISVVAVWDGPPIEQGAAWQAEPDIRDLVARLAARRTPMEDAQKRITQFLNGDAAAKTEKGKLLFAGLFETLNSERGAVMNGLERLARSEKALAEEIRSDTSAMHELQDAPSPDQAKIDELATRIEWNMRIFEDRRKSIRFACEVPVIIEKRLFALSRSIAQTMEP